MTFSVLFTFTDFQLIYVLTRGGPLNATHLMATLKLPARDPRWPVGEGAAIAVAMIPFLLAAIMFSYFGLQRRALGARRPRLDRCPTAEESFRPWPCSAKVRQDGERRSRTYRQTWTTWCRCPRRWVTIYIPADHLRDRAAVPVPIG